MCPLMPTTPAHRHCKIFNQFREKRSLGAPYPGSPVVGSINGESSANRPATIIHTGLDARKWVELLIEAARTGTNMLACMGSASAHFICAANPCQEAGEGEPIGEAIMPRFPYAAGSSRPRRNLYNSKSKSKAS